MHLIQILIAIVAAAALIAIPLVLIWSMVVHFRSPPSKRRGGGSTSSAVGAAMLELDRLVARPSVEHTVEAQQNVLRREDDQGGD